jgi:hypothetical protein
MSLSRELSIRLLATLAGLLLLFCYLYVTRRPEKPSNPTLNSNLSAEETDIEKLLRQIKEEGGRTEATMSSNMTAASANSHITYEHLKKNAGAYVGQAWMFTGKVLEIHENNYGTWARVASGEGGTKAMYARVISTQISLKVQR